MRTRVTLSAEGSQELDYQKHTGLADGMTAESFHRVPSISICIERNHIFWT